MSISSVLNSGPDVPISLTSPMQTELFRPFVGKLEAPAVVHCFTGTAEEAAGFLELGLYIGAFALACPPIHLSQQLAHSFARFHLREIDTPWRVPQRGFFAVLQSVLANVSSRHLAPFLKRFRALFRTGRIHWLAVRRARGARRSARGGGAPRAAGQAPYRDGRSLFGADSADGMQHGTPMGLGREARRTVHSGLWLQCVAPKMLYGAQFVRPHRFLQVPRSIKPSKARPKKNEPCLLPHVAAAVGLARGANGPFPSCVASCNVPASMIASTGEGSFAASAFPLIPFAAVAHATFQFLSGCQV